MAINMSKASRDQDKALIKIIKSIDSPGLNIPSGLDKDAFYEWIQSLDL